MRTPRFKRHAQRLALAQQVSLANHLIELRRAQPLGQRRIGSIGCSANGSRGGVVIGFERQAQAVLHGSDCRRS